MARPQFLAKYSNFFCIHSGIGHYIFWQFDGCVLKVLAWLVHPNDHGPTKVGAMVKTIIGCTVICFSISASTLSRSRPAVPPLSSLCFKLLVVQLSITVPVTQDKKSNDISITTPIPWVASVLHLMQCNLREYYAALNWTKLLLPG